MRELVEQGEVLRNIVTVVIRFATNNLNIYTIQDVMHDMQLSTYWLNKAVSEYFEDTEDSVQHNIDSIEEPQPSTELPTESLSQLKYISDSLEGILKVVDDHLDMPLSEPTKFCINCARMRLTEGIFNTRMTVLAYEGLQSLRRPA